MSTETTYRTVHTDDLIRQLYYSEGVREQLSFSNLKTVPGNGTTSITTIPIITNYATVVGNDIINPNLIIINSHKGESSLKIMLGFIRLVCSNGMTVGESEFNAKIIHRSGPKIEKFLEHWTHEVAAALDRLQPSITSLNALTNVNVDPNPINIFERCLNLLERGILTKKALKEVVWTYNNPEHMRRADHVHINNAWGFWNICNEALRNAETKRSSPASSLQRNTKLLPAILDYKLVA